MMRTFTIEDIRALNPCYDPGLHLPEDWKGTALDILQLPGDPVDGLWLVLRRDWIDDRVLRLFVTWCARQALAKIEGPDRRSVEACDVAERYAKDQATRGEMAASKAAAEAAALEAASASARATVLDIRAIWANPYDTTWEATRAAKAAAWDAARAAARAAGPTAWDAAARDAAWAASRAAARAAKAGVWAAAGDITSAAAWAATQAAGRDAARAAGASARDDQIAQLLKMLRAGPSGQERDS